MENIKQPQTQQQQIQLPESLINDVGVITEHVTTMNVMYKQAVSQWKAWEARALKAEAEVKDFKNVKDTDKNKGIEDNKKGS